jgi:iron transport multicopper oxidase
MPLKISEKMSEKMAFLLFGDQSLDTHDFLADLCHRGNLSVLSRSFLEQVDTALREEVDQLPSLERQRLPNFSSIQDLNKRYHNGGVKNSAVDSVLLCITQLAHYIELVECLV